MSSGESNVRVLGIELRASHMLSMCSSAQKHSFEYCVRIRQAVLSYDNAVRYMSLLSFSRKELC